MATKFYFIRRDQPSTIYEMSCTQDISITTAANVTSRPTESKSDITDHYKLGNTIVSYTGYITSVRNTSTVLDINKWIDDIEDARASVPTPLWTVYSNGRVVSNCVISDFRISTSPVVGVGAWKVDMSFQNIRVVDRATLVDIPTPQEDVNKDVNGKTRANSNTTKPLEKELVNTIGLELVDGGYSMLVGDPNANTN